MRLAFAIMSAVLLTGCVIIDFGPLDRYQAGFHYSYELQPGGHLNLENLNGPVEISGWDESKVEITGVKYASTREGLEAVRIDIHHTPASIDIRTWRPSAHYGNIGARYALRVPRTAVLGRVTTSNGQLRVHDLDTGAYLKSSNGAIRVENLGGAVDAQTSNASIELHSIGGGAKLRTSNGRIHAEDIGGECNARTSNSSITIEFNRAPKNGIRAETSNGGITVRLPGNTAARLEAGTSNGSITTDFDITGNGARDHLNGTIGGGGPLIELTTRNGHIGILRM